MGVGGASLEVLKLSHRTESCRCVLTSVCAYVPMVQSDTIVYFVLAQTWPFAFAVTTVVSCSA